MAWSAVKLLLHIWGGPIWNCDIYCNFVAYSDEHSKRHKRNKILRALNANPPDIATLQQLAISRGGLLDDCLRKHAWPCLLDIDVSSIPHKPGTESHPLLRFWWLLFTHYLGFCWLFGKRKVTGNIIYSETPKLWLLSYLWSITTSPLVPNYTAWWQRHVCMISLPRAILYCIVGEVIR